MRRLGRRWGRVLALVPFLATASALAVTVEVEEDCVGMGEVVWSQKVQANGMTKLVLKAEAAEGYAFSGWIVEDESGQAWPADSRYAGSLTATVSTNASVVASFISKSEDELFFSLGDVLPTEVACGEKVSCPIEIDSISFPTLTFRGLPSGLTYDDRTLTLVGKPNVPGVYQIEASGINASGFSFWCCAEMHVGNIGSERLSGSDVEIPLDEYFHARPEELFDYEEEILGVTLTGVPPGLTWDEEWQLLYGTPTEPGDYTIWAKVEFATGASETATLLLSVVAPDPSEYDVSLDSLDFVQVGDEFEAEDSEIGTDSNDSGIVEVSDLPTGLSIKKWREGGVRHWGISGQLTKAGRYRVWVSVADDSGVTQRVVRTSRVITVNDMPQQYLTAVPSDALKGSVLGAGAVTPGLPVTLTAKPAAGQVFAGWQDDFGEWFVLDDGTDYRTMRLTLPANTEYSMLFLLAQFVSSEEDAAPDVSDLDEVSLVLTNGQPFEHSFNVVSLSLPTLTFKGLPSGVLCSSLGTGEYVLTYDEETVEKKLLPGRYAVTLTAENRSGRKSTVKFSMTVPNKSDPRVRVEDDYGEFDPGEPIYPIDLSAAVDFGRGETLSVAGLPKGLAYNAKADAKKGIAAHTITGTPTVPGDYTLTFTAKVVTSAKTNSASKVTYSYETVKVSSFITILPYPELLVQMDEEAAEAGCKVTGGGHYKPGTKVTLKATAAKGWVFAGWDGLDEVDFPQTLKPQLSYTSGPDDVWASASFMTVDADYLYIDDPTTADSDSAVELELGIAVEEAGADMLVCDLIDSGSWPTVKIMGLPTGLKFTASTLLLSGKPTKSGVYHVTVSAKNAGGYSFVRVFDIIVLNADGTRPEEKPLANEAEIDFTPWAGLMTGVRCLSEGRILKIPSNPSMQAAVKKVSVSGLPAGLKAMTYLADDGGAEIELTGMPTQPGRFVVSVTVSYVSGKSAKSQRALVVEDAGSSYLYVQPAAEGGSVTGEGVYAAGQTVKLTAKADRGYVFSGWTLSDGTPLDLGDVDYRTQNVSLTMRVSDSMDDGIVLGNFVTTADDQKIELSFPEGVWSISPDEPSACSYSLTSASLPKVTVKGLPKGVALNAVCGEIVYTPTTTVVPGIYSAELSVKNVTVTKAKTFPLEIHVANFESDAIGGLDPSMDAYTFSVGVVLDPATIVPKVGDGWTLSVKGLPSGLSFKDGAVIGTPAKVGNYTVTFTATTGKGKDKQTEVATIVIRVAALPVSLTGTFNGFLMNDEGGIVGTMTVAAAASGKVSASVALPSGKQSFSAKSWDAFDGEHAELSVLSKSSNLSIELDAQSGWPAWQLTGEFCIGEVCYTVTGQRFPYDKTGGDPVAKDEIAALAGQSTLSGWTAKITTKGTVTLAGKHEGRKINGTSALFCDENGYFAEIISFADKKSILSICFRFDEEGQMTEIRTQSVIVP